jgi:hypothetical protein
MTEPSRNDVQKPETPAPATRPMFPHPPWMVGVVLILAVLSILAGFSNPIWFALGMPSILVLILYIYVRVVTGKRARDNNPVNTPDDPR